MMTELITSQEAQTPPALLNEENMRAMGITHDDLPAIAELATKLTPVDTTSVAEFGHSISEHTSTFTDTLLKQVRSADLDDAGRKLTEVVVAAKAINLHALSDRRSRIPLIGHFLDRLKLTKDRFVTQFQNAETQIDTLLTEISTTQTGLSQRITDLGATFDSVKDEYRLLGRHIAAGRIKLEEFRTEADAMRKRALSPAEVQELADRDTLIANLDKRVGDLQVLQQSSLQALPMIRMIQANNHMLVDKFHTIRELTVPAWKRQFMLALSLNEQKNAVELAGRIDDATNQFLRQNSELLRDNSVATAKANQRLVIDVATLEKVQNTLIQTVNDVIRIQEEGIKGRHEAEMKLHAMRDDLEQRLTRKLPETRAAQ